MLDNTGIRQLCYMVKIDDIKPVLGSDHCECAVVNGWTVLVRKNTFEKNSLAIYFEIDSHVDVSRPEFEFLAKRHGNIKVQKYTFGGKNPGFYSQGLLMSPEDFGWKKVEVEEPDGKHYIEYQDKEGNLYKEGDFLTSVLNVVYSVDEDNDRKAKVNPDAKINAALARHPKIAKKWGKTIKKNKMLRKLFLLLFGRKKDVKTHFPTKFQYIKRTDQERCENMTWVLEDKTPYIVTQKCDGSSGTYILEKKSFGRFEFYVCSRNVRQLTPNQKSFYDDNYYWECAIKYDIENKLKDYLKKHPELEYVCWQGEVCAPKIQGNPHGLTETHLFCFHMIDSIKGKYDLQEAVKIWKEYNMETVPIIDENYIFENDFEEFKQSAEGYYDSSVCEGKTNQEREGLVYYKTTDPNFSFKNVSRKYLLKHS